jgi:SRSO17 transposase
VTAPANVGAQHQSLLHFVGEAPWSDERVLAKVREMVLPAIERLGPIDAWIIDDTGFPKQGRHSVGVSHRPSRSRDVLPKINSNGRRVSVHWFTGVLQSLCSPS